MIGILSYVRFCKSRESGYAAAAAVIILEQARTHEVLVLKSNNIPLLLLFIFSEHLFYFGIAFFRKQTFAIFLKKENWSFCITKARVSFCFDRTYMT